MNDLPQRKLQRLKDYDYSQNGAYFITVCTQNRQQLLGEIADNKTVLNNAGKMVEERLLNISNDKNILMDKYIVMPDHIHAIIMITQNGTTQGSFPTLSEIVCRFKTITTKLYIDGVKNGNYPSFNKKIWQKSFNDRIIRNEQGYHEVCQYIERNPLKKECFLNREYSSEQIVENVYNNACRTNELLEIIKKQGDR